MIGRIYEQIPRLTIEILAELLQRFRIEAPHFLRQIQGKDTQRYIRFLRYDRLEGQIDRVTSENDRELPKAELENARLEIDNFRKLIEQEEDK